MIQWLVNTANWLIGIAGDLLDFRDKFISNPYYYIRSLLDWVYDRAIYVIDAVKHEIADWVYGLYISLVGSINYVYSLVIDNIQPIVSLLWNWIVNLPANIAPVVQGLIDATVTWIYDRIQEVISSVTYWAGVILEIRDWLYNLLINSLAGIQSDIAWLKANTGAIDLSDLYRKVGELWLFIADFDIAIRKTVTDNLLDWIEDRLAEALE